MCTCCVHVLTHRNCAHLMLLCVYDLGSLLPRDRCHSHFQMQMSMSDVLSKHTERLGIQTVWKGTIAFMLLIQTPGIEK